MPSLSVNDTAIYYEQEGTGVPLVLIVGYNCDSSQWSLVRPTLAQDFTLLLIDNRGSGRSGSPDVPYSVSLMAADIAELMAALNLTKAHVLGHSMGGAIAQEFAYRYPHLVDRLILSNSLIKFPANTAMAFKWLLDLREGGLSPHLLVEGGLPWVYSSQFLANPDNVREAVESTLANPYPQSLAGQKRQFEALIAFDSEFWFEKIKARTLVIAGAEDICAGVTNSERLSKGIPHAELVRLPGIGHVPLVESPAEFASLVRNFLIP
jgi:pimeloyl-ACP methyl ester carboxylesterase